MSLPMDAHASMTPADLADLLSAFNDVTGKLGRTHDELKAEVARLNRELSEANSQLARSQRLAALGEMAAGIAHEIRNPLGSIRLYARMLEDDLAGRDKERGLATRIQGAAGELERIVRDVLAFAREVRLDLRACDVSEVIERAVEACRHDGVPGWQSVGVVRAEGGGDGLLVRGDSALLAQALANVLRNAYEAMAETPRATPHRIEISAFDRRDAQGAWVVISVKDTGPGIGKDVVSRMFNPFFTTRASGTGLGLAIVHRIVESHAGRVVVRNNSERGQEPGATVEIVVPAWGENVNDRPAPAEDS
ncbi:MAG: GHKL domain-containing protein [Phycisphaerales bacterium]|nr:GHKL domain-containing protein [Phycisphaerales bacterium]